MRRKGLSPEVAARKDEVGLPPNYKQANLQHRHFKFIAAVIAKINSTEARIAAHNLFAYWCSKSNASFDDARFKAACELDVERYPETKLDWEITMLALHLEYLHAEKIRRHPDA